MSEEKKTTEGENPDELEIVVEGPEPEPEEGTVPAAAQTPPPVQKSSEEEEERARSGKRAERRINRLVKERNELRERLAKEQQEREALVLRARTTETHAVTQHEQRLEEAEKRLRAEYSKAEEEADNNAKWEITKNLATVEAERLALRTYKNQNPPPVPAQAPERQEQPRVPVSRPEVDPQAESWYQENNNWFLNQADPTAVQMTQAALAVDRQLMTEGFDPREPPEPGEKFNDFYRELNYRMKKQFPDKFAAPAKGPKSPVAPAPRTVGNTGGKRTVKLTPSEYSRAQRLGVDPKDFAREKEKILRARGDSNAQR